MSRPLDGRPRSSHNTCARAVPLLVEGRLKQDTWEDKTTKQKKSKLKVVLEGFSFIDSKGPEGGDRVRDAPRRARSRRLPRARPAGCVRRTLRQSKKTTFHFNNLILCQKHQSSLIQNIVGLGGESDLVKVAAGYARNYLFPQGLAVPVTAANKRRIEALRQRRADREAHEFNTMTELSKSISKLIAVIAVKTGEDGKMFGAVTAGMIADQLKTQFDIVLGQEENPPRTPDQNLGRARLGTAPASGSDRHS